MILREATIKYSGNDPNTLSKGSAKRICCSCDGCGRVRWSTKLAYRDLCVLCGHKHVNKGKNNPFYGKHHSDKSKIKMSESSPKASGKNHSMFGKHHSEETRLKMSKLQLGKLNHGWKGGFNKKRSYLIAISRCLHINERFEGSHAHHIAADVIVFIPRDLHYHINHSLKDGKGMYEMNMLALQFINGGL